MSNSRPPDTFPKGALLGGALLLGVTLIFVATVRLAHIEPAAQVPSAAQASVSRALKFADQPNGDVVVSKVDENGVETRIAVLEPGTDGFIRAVMRGLVQARKIDDIGPETPFLLSRLPDGRLVLSDPATGRRVYLRAFGPTNAEAFGRLLSDDDPDTPPQAQWAHTGQHENRS